MAFSGDPVTVIKPFIDIIDAVETEMTKAKIKYLVEWLNWDLIVKMIITRTNMLKK